MLEEAADEKQSKASAPSLNNAPVLKEASRNAIPVGFASLHTVPLASKLLTD